MRRWRRWRTGAIAVVITAALVLVAAGFLRRAGAWAIVMAPNFDRETTTARPPEDVRRVIRAEVGPPDAILEAWVIEPEEPRGTTLVLHGIRGDKTAMIGLGRALRARGQRAVLVDLRGHGGSSGRWLTYGVLEARDLSQLLDQLDALGLIDAPLSVYGASYGGAVALSLAAIDERVQRVVSVSTFASLREVVPPYAELQLGALAGWIPSAILDSVVDEAGELAAFAPDAADTREAITRTHAHVLLVHGLADRHVPFAHARALYEACTHDRCTLLPIEGGDHPGTLASDRTSRAALQFLNPP